MSRANLNHEPNHNATQRIGRRQKFRTKFEELPLGMFDVQKLAKKAKVTYRTALAFLKELHRENLVSHRIVHRCVHGFEYENAVSSRVK